MKKILLLGGNGNVGKTLVESLGDKYHFIVYDKCISSINDKCECRICDASDYNALLAEMPDDIECIIILSSVKTEEGLLNPASYGTDFYDAFIRVPYNAFYIAKEKHISKVILCSTNHVTGLLEHNGYSMKENGERINVSDAFCPEGLYGALKAASELVGKSFSVNHGISVFNLRIGTYRHNETYKTERSKRTWLRRQDLVEIFDAILESSMEGIHTYYCVSNNKDCPWSVEELKNDFPFLSMFKEDSIIE